MVLVVVQCEMLLLTLTTQSRWWRQDIISPVLCIYSTPSVLLALGQTVHGGEDITVDWGDVHAHYSCSCVSMDTAVL